MDEAGLKPRSESRADFARLVRTALERCGGIVKSVGLHRRGEVAPGI